MEEIIKNILLNYVLKSIIVILISYLVYEIIMYIAKKNMNLISKKGNLSNKFKTYIKIFGNTIRYSYLIITIIILLQINGVNVSAIVAGLGVAGLVGGLALQDLLKDIIMGSNIITDDFFMLGDVVEFNGIQGKVINLGLKTTKIEDIYTKNIITITNRNIDKITRVSDWLDIDIPLSYGDNVERIENVLTEIVDQIKTGKNIKKCEYLGLNKFCDSSILYKIRIYCSPEYKPNINRFALRIIKLALDKNKIEIPFNQLDIHNIK